MADFFVTRNSRSAVQHIVHRHDCADLPPQSDTLYLGRYLSGRHALEVARALHEEAEACKVCMPECHPVRASTSFGKSASTGG